MAYFNTVAISLVLLLGVLQLAHFSMLQQLTQLHTEEEESIRVESERSAKAARAFFDSLPSDSTGQYRVESNILPPGNLSTQNDVTLVTQCSPSHLHHLADIAERWNGPISVAVFVQGHEIAMMRRLMKVFQRCPQALGQRTGIHLVYVESQLSGVSLQASSSLDSMSQSGCVDGLMQLSNVNQKNYALKVPYPNNLLRNVARDNAMTHFIFVVDIDMVPSSSVHDNFLTFAHNNDLFALRKAQDKEVYVVPVFEARPNLAYLPSAKAELIGKVSDHSVRPFYLMRCDKCHRHTDYKRWLQLPASKAMNIAYDVEWKDAWEPFYIGRKAVPRYDERFKQYGFNRISNVCQLHMAGYTFHVMDTPFLVHKGFKEKGQFHAEKDIENSINRDLYTVFRRELHLRYADSKRQCI